MSNLGNNPQACAMFGHAWIIKPRPGNLETVCQNCGTVAD